MLRSFTLCIPEIVDRHSLEHNRTYHFFDWIVGHDIIDACMHVMLCWWCGNRFYKLITRANYDCLWIPQKQGQVSLEIDKGNHCT